MIVDSDLILTSARGTERRVIEAGDTSLTIPPVLQATYLPILQTQAANTGTEVQRFSSMSGNEVSRTNQAALDTTVLTLEKGLWRINFSCSSAFNWAHVVGTAVGEVEVYANFDSGVQTLYASFARIGTHDFQRELTILALANFEIHHSIGITGVGQTTDSMFQINASKIL